MVSTGQNNDDKINQFKIQKNLLNLSGKVRDIAKLQSLKINTKII